MTTNDLCNGRLRCGWAGGKRQDVYCQLGVGRMWLVRPCEQDVDLCAPGFSVMLARHESCLGGRTYFMNLVDTTHITSLSLDFGFFFDPDAP